MHVQRDLPSLTLLYSPQQIAERVRDMGQELSRTFAGQEPIVVGILKGAFIFVADLVRAMDIPLSVDFVQAASYGETTQTAGRVRLVQDLSCDIQDRDVILVDTVLDTGLTLTHVTRQLEKQKPRSITICVLVKKEERTQVEVAVDQVGFVLSNGFIVGYGTDFGERYRQLDGLYVREEEE